jgi:hypothetical protein
MPNETNLIFKCPKCTWWIAGTHISPEPLTKLQVDEQMFDLKCEEEGCGWSGQQAGREGRPNVYLVTEVYT